MGTDKTDLSSLLRTVIIDLIPDDPAKAEKFYERNVNYVSTDVSLVDIMNFYPTLQMIKSEQIKFVY